MPLSKSSSRARRDQLLACTLGVAFLAGSIAPRPILSTQRSQIVTESETSLRSLAVNFPRLTLGGFRGLLATVLWIQAENDKQERKWVELETKYDIIGALQPYFVSVYIFHAWNQAYNLSAQWHDNEAKYKWVLDGLAYLNKGEDYNPQNPDILVEQGNMFFLKLGGSFERIWYRAHWRDDMARFVELKYINLPKSDRTDALKLVHEFVLRVSPENREAYAKTNDPIEQQKLRTFGAAELLDPTGVSTRTGYGISIIAPELFDARTDHKAASDPMPFRFGLSPYYFSYVEFRRLNQLADKQHVYPTTTTMRVVGAWPAMSLRLWCRDDLYYSQQTMAALFGPEDQASRVDPTVPGNLARFQDKLSEIKDCYRNVSLIAPKAVAFFNEHLAKPEFKRDIPIHQKHIKESIAYEAIGKAESALFDALIAWHTDNRQLNPAVRQQFTAALPLYDKAIQITREWVDVVSPVKEGQPYPMDRADFDRYVAALAERKQGIENLLRTQPPEKPNMEFLTYEIVER